MRLIDGDSLCRSLVDWMFESFGKDDGHDVEFELINKVVAGIDAHPTIDAVPVVRCRECRHFQLDAWGTVNGVPLIVAHEICDLWAGGCKTSPDGYCFGGERKDGADNATD